MANRKIVKTKALLDWGRVVENELEYDNALGELVKVRFDQIYLKTTENEFFQAEIRDMVDQWIEGQHNASICCLGPTGSGKSHTLFGSANDGMIQKTIKSVQDRIREKILISWVELKGVLEREGSRVTKKIIFFDLIANKKTSSIKSLFYLPYILLFFVSYIQNSN